MIGYLHTAFLLIAIVLFLLQSLIALVILQVIGFFLPEKKLQMVFRYVQFFFRLTWKLTGCPLTISGLENIPDDRAVLFVGNHRSYLDIVAVGCAVPHPIAFVAKDRMEKVPLIRLWMKQIHCLFLNREDIRQGLQVILAAIEEIKNGLSIFIFPEGTRNRGEDALLPFHAGSFKIALKPGAPVVPVVINGTEDLLEPHFPRFVPHPVSVTFLTPILTEGIDRQTAKDVPARTEETIRTEYLRRRKEAGAHE